MSEARPDGLDQVNARQCGLNLFLVGFLVLFFELACIRWFSVYVIFLQFFTNVVLIACFLGMSCGCLAAHRRSNWLARFPFIALATVLALPVACMIAAVPQPSAIRRTIFSCEMCFCGCCGRPTPSLVHASDSHTRVRQGTQANRNVRFSPLRFASKLKRRPFPPGAQRR